MPCELSLMFVRISHRIKASKSDQVFMERIYTELAKVNAFYASTSRK